MKPSKYILIILFLIGIVVYLNQIEKQAIDRSKIPERVEESSGFQRWITNLKNKDFTIEADEFRLVEENEIYNSKWMKVYSIDDEERMAEYEQRIQEVEDTDKVNYAPSERAYVDYKDEKRFGYMPNEVYYYGIRDNKILDARIVDCSVNANCYFDRAYFIEDSNDVVVVSEFSRNIDKRAENVETCTIDQECTYTIKIHVVDLLRNSRLVYESNPFDIILSEKKQDL